MHATKPRDAVGLPDQLDLFREADRIDAELEAPILEACTLFVTNLGAASTFQTESQQRAWWWAVKASKYNAVYYVSRNCALRNIDWIRAHAHEINLAGHLIDKHCSIAPIVNYALHRYVQLADRDHRVRAVTTSTPEYAIQGIDDRTIAVRARHFLEQTPEKSFTIASECFDWHDLAHILAAATSGGAFGCKYHDGLHELPRYYRALTEGAGASDASGPLLSDGLLFTHLSRALFEQCYSNRLLGSSLIGQHIDIQSLIAAELANYLDGNYPLFHPALNRAVTSPRPVTITELAVLMQNKRYERRGAEAEYAVLVRGTPDGPRGNATLDPLIKMSHAQRLIYIAGSPPPLYFEVRNLVRHCAHEDALGHVARRMADDVHDDQDTADFAQAILDFHTLTDLSQGQETNLYQLVDNAIRETL